MISRPPKTVLTCGGFTLIELMVVIVLIGIMTALILPEMRGTFEDALLRSSARQIADACSLANSRAITLNQEHRVRVDGANGRFQIESKAGAETKGAHGFLPLRDVSGAEGEIDKRISISLLKPEQGSEEEGQPSDSQTREESDRNTLTFYPDGTADSQRIMLRDRVGFLLVIDVNPVTARVQIKEQPSQ